MNEVMKAAYEKVKKTFGGGITGNARQKVDPKPIAKKIFENPNLRKKLGEISDSFDKR